MATTFCKSLSRACQKTGPQAPSGCMEIAEGLWAHCFRNLYGAFREATCNVDEVAKQSEMHLLLLGP